jgi:hypothetical protein
MAANYPPAGEAGSPQNPMDPYRLHGIGGAGGFIPTVAREQRRDESLIEADESHERSGG